MKWKHISSLIIKNYSKVIYNKQPNKLLEGFLYENDYK